MSVGDDPNEASGLREELLAFVRPLEMAAADEYYRRTLLESMGWNPDALSETTLGTLERLFRDVVASVEALIAYLDDPPDDLEEFLAAVERVAALVEQVQSVHDVLSQADPSVEATTFERLAEDLFGHLVTLYLQREHPGLYEIGILLTLVRPPDAAAVSERIEGPGGEVYRFPSATARVRLDRVPDLLSDPVDAVATEHVPINPTTPEGARRLIDDVLPYVVDFVSELGGDVTYGTETTEPVTGIPDLAEELATIWLSADATGRDATVGARVILYVDQAGDVRALVVPRADAAVETRAEGWVLDLSLTATVDGITVGTDGVAFPPGEDAGGVSVRANTRFLGWTDRPSGESATEPLDPEPAVRIGGADSTRLDLASPRIEAAADVSHAGPSVDVLAATGDSTFVLDPGDGGTFLARLLPTEGVHSTFDLGVGWSTERGLYLQGSGGLTLDLPVHWSFGEFLSLDYVHVGVTPKPVSGTVPVYLAVSARGKLGPVKASVKRVGLQAELSFPEDRDGNLGPVHVDFGPSNGFKPPAGAGLSIDAAAVTGGGYLEYDHDAGRYAGAIQLKFGEIVLNAVGLLTTKRPDGRPGFSLLVIIAGEFPPLQLGFGFTLNAVGGLLGLNRSVVPGVLQSGVRTGSLNSVLFPRDPVANAPAIISDLGRIFPESDGRFVVGPMARLGWGTPPIVTADLGIVLELPAPVKLMILGRLRVALPNQAIPTPVVVINVDAVGDIDFEGGTAAVTARLYDSRVVTFALTGEMALRTSWKGRRAFALSVGGLNPRYPRLPEFPELDRLTLALSSGDNPRLRCAAYFAVTGNSFQAGAQAELYAAAAGLSVSGHLGFDALVEFPFRFVVDVRAGIEIAGKINLLVKTIRFVIGASLDLTLSGPKPWHARGTARVKFMGVRISVPFELSIGPSDRPPALQPVAIVPHLLRELNDRRNWSAQLPDDSGVGVVLRELTPTDDEILAHPRGTLRMRQRTVPLDVDVETFANAPPADATRFEVAAARVGGATVPEKRIAERREEMARAPFFRLQDPLAEPEFESLPVGVAVESRETRFGGVGDAPESTDPVAPVVELTYEREVIDRVEGYRAVVERREPTVSGDTIDRLAQIGRVARSDLETTGEAKFAGPDQAVGVDETAYVVARTDDLTRATGPNVPPGGTTRTEAKQAMERFVAENPSRAGEFQVVPRREARSV